MKRYFILLVALSLILSGCLRSLEKEGITNEITYKGRVIDASNKPLSGIMVRITNGNLIHNSTMTDNDGIFQVSVNIANIDSKYYIQIGDEASYVKRSSLKGFGQGIYDYGDIPFVDIKLPTVETVGVTNMTEKSFTCKCNVKSQGGAIVTDRGLCWSTNIPTISDHKEKFGSGEGEYSVTVSNENFDFHSTSYYARAYAINEYGIAYGDAVELNSSKLKEFSLPTMKYGGYTYTIHPDLGGMTWKQANTACENLLAEGYNDWYLPNKEEMLAIAEKTNVLDSGKRYWTSTEVNSVYGEHYHVTYDSQTKKWETEFYGIHDDSILRTIPVRKEK